jgi:transcriptional regulator with XRE-family HTH domain
MSTTGERIRELRLRNNLTLDDVARYLGVGRQAIYKYEQGTVTNIPLENLEKMATLFGTTPGYLAGWSEKPPDTPREDGRPRTIQGRFLAQGVDTMPVDLRDRIVNMMLSGYPEFFKGVKYDDENDT